MKERVKITDYLFFQEGPGVRNTQYTTSGVKLLNVSNLVDGEIDLSNSDRYISNDEAYGKYKHFLVDEGDLIIASSGIKVDYLDKKVGFIKKEHLPLCMNTSTIRFKALDDKALNIKYFKYYLQSNDFKYQVSKSITGSAQLNYGPSHLKQMSFILYDLDEQNKIVERLDKINNIIQKHKKTMNYLDTLIKARFVEMFGNINNYKVNIDVKKFKDICTVHQGLQIPISDRKKEPGPNRYKYITIQYLNGKKEEEYIENPNNSVLCKAEDILMTRTGNTGQVVTDVEGCFHNNFFIIDYNKKELNRIFLLTFLRQKEVRDMMVKVATTSTIPDLNHDKFYEIDIPIPTIDLQNTFATFVNHVDKLKFDVQKSLEKTQMLFDSLMQEYFG